MMKTFHVLGAIALLFGLVSCQPAQQAQQAEPAEPPMKEEPVKLSPAEQMEKINAALDDTKSELANAGKYSCCTFPSCNWCALHEGTMCLLPERRGQERGLPRMRSRLAQWQRNGGWLYGQGCEMEHHA